MQPIIFSALTIALSGALSGMVAGVTPAIATLNPSPAELPKPELSVMPKQSTPYVVVVPGNSAEERHQVIQVLRGAGLLHEPITIERSSRGVFICAGSFSSRSLAQTRVSVLRDNGLDARVAYLRRIRCG